MQRIENMTRLSEFREFRQNFGSGRAGRKAFKYVIRGVPCEAREVDEQRRYTDQKCGKRSKMTVDIRVPLIGDLEQYPVCGILCEGLVREGIEKDFPGIDIQRFSRNGLGRA